MNIFLNILITIIFSILTCIIYDFVRSYILTKKLKELNKDNKEYSWDSFWADNFPNYNDFTDKEE